jgi:hypothetical protein
MSVAACEPELPPVEVMSGTKKISTNTAFMASSKCARALKVSIWARNRNANQNARFRHTLKKDASR